MEDGRETSRTSSSGSLGLSGWEEVKSFQVDISVGGRAPLLPTADQTPSPPPKAFHIVVDPDRLTLDHRYSIHTP